MALLTQHLAKVFCFVKMERPPQGRKTYYAVKWMHETGVVVFWVAYDKSWHSSSGKWVWASQGNLYWKKNQWPKDSNITIGIVKMKEYNKTVRLWLKNFLVYKDLCWYISILISLLTLYCSVLQWRPECDWQCSLYLQCVPEGHRQRRLHSDPRRCQRGGGEDVPHLG